MSNVLIIMACIGILLIPVGVVIIVGISYKFLAQEPKRYIGTTNGKKLTVEELEKWARGEE